MNEPDGGKRIAPIPTTYAGYRMRSRLEARWAVYFDTLKIKWEYEKEGYDLTKSQVHGSAELGYYLPDFWLPQVEMWAEVKPGDFSKLDIRKCTALAQLTGHPCLMLDGLPEFKVYWAAGGEDYILDARHLEENRFYSRVGLRRGQSLSDIWVNDAATNACHAAKSARFERGESGASK